MKKRRPLTAAARIAALEVDCDILRARAVRAEKRAAEEEEKRTALLDLYISQGKPFDGTGGHAGGIGSSVAHAQANCGMQCHVPTVEQVEETPYPPARPVVTDFMPGDMVMPARRHCLCEVCSSDVRAPRGKLTFIGGLIHAPRGFVGEVHTLDPATRQFWLKNHSRTLACSWDQWRRVT